MTGLGSSCGACRFLRRKCAVDCVFAPYFSYDQATTHFAAVHKVFGASNVSRLLLNLPPQYRNEAAMSLCYEALARMQDPIHGCVAYIYALQQQVASLQEEISILGNGMASPSTVGDSTASGGSFHQWANASCEVQSFTLHHDSMNAPWFRDESALAVSLEGIAAMQPGLDSHLDTRFLTALGWEDSLLGEFNASSL